MAAGDTQITLIGNLTDDPELKFTTGGHAVTNFRVASTPRLMDKESGQWKDGDPLFMRCSLWRQPAENVAESLVRGARVIVVGRLKQRSYETAQGEKRTVYEVEVDEVGPSLRYATAKIEKLQRSGGGGGNSQPAARQASPAPAQSSGFGDDPWANTAPSPATSQGGFADEPPY